MHSKFNETLIGVGVSWLCLHAIALMIYSNGYAHSGNLAWQLISPILQAERFLLITCAVLLVAFAVILIIVDLFKLNEPPPKPDEISVCTQPVHTETVVHKPAQNTEPLHKPKPAKPPKIIIPPPPKPPPTAKELKQKAIKQITGRSI